VTDAGSSVVQTIPIAAPGGGGLGCLGISPNGKNVYVAIQGGSAIAVIDTTTHQISSFIETIHNPLGVVVSRDGTTLYVTDEDDNLEVFSLPTNELLFTLPVGSSPQIPGVSPDGTMVYVACTDGTITTIDYDTGLVGSITVGGEPFQVVFNAAGTEAYACNSNQPYISVINTATAAVTQITTPSATIGLVIDGTKLYATSLSEVFLINTTTKTVDTIPVPNPTNAALGVPALTPDGKYLYAGAFEILGPPVTLGESLIVIDTNTKKVVGQPIPVGVGPVQVVTAPNGKLGYVSNELSGTVSVIKLLK
jgi:YVTN family beta-propeller protein